MKVLVNGCFDCFHEGHIYLLKKALQFSRTHLRVLINSDASVRELKGIKRPIDSLKKRLENIYHFFWEYQPMDPPLFDIIPFNKETDLAKEIDKFEPDMILKGNDRPDVREIVGSNKWPVCIIPRLKDPCGQDISTTNKLIKLKEHLAKLDI